MAAGLAPTTKALHPDPHPLPPCPICPFKSTLRVQHTDQPVPFVGQSPAFGAGLSAGAILGGPWRTQEAVAALARRSWANLLPFAPGRTAKVVSVRIARNGIRHAGRAEACGQTQATNHYLPNCALRLLVVIMHLLRRINHLSVDHSVPCDDTLPPRVHYLLD